jgi:hypothetical protein
MFLRKRKGESNSVKFQGLTPWPNIIGEMDFIIDYDIKYRMGPGERELKRKTIDFYQQ